MKLPKAEISLYRQKQIRGGMILKESMNLYRNHLPTLIRTNDGQAGPFLRCRDYQKRYCCITKKIPYSVEVVVEQFKENRKRIL